MVGPLLDWCSVSLGRARVHTGSCETVPRPRLLWRRCLVVVVIVIVVVIKSQSQGRDRGERNTLCNRLGSARRNVSRGKTVGGRGRPRQTRIVAAPVTGCADETGMKELLRIPGKTDCRRETRSEERIDRRRAARANEHSSSSSSFAASVSSSSASSAFASKRIHHERLEETNLESEEAPPGKTTRGDSCRLASEKGLTQRTARYSSRA